jgi:hypothetical protein
MPRATAVWLIDNTRLTFEQIAEFCGMHLLEVQGIADSDVAVDVKGLNPIQNGQLTREEIERCEADPSLRLKLTASLTKTIASNKAVINRTVKYTPIARRENKPNAIAWLLKNCPELSDKQIAKIVGSTTPTVISIKHKEHWNMQNISPKDPVLLGMCTRADLDMQLEKARLLNEAANK